MKQSIDVQPSSDSGFGCKHCGSTATPQKLASCPGKELYEEIDGEMLAEDVEYEIYQCSSCDGVTLLRDSVQYPRHKSQSARQVYPPRAA
jgi:hypothetical protein